MCLQWHTIHSVTCVFVFKKSNEGVKSYLVVLEQQSANRSSDGGKSTSIKLNMSITCIPVQTDALLNVKNVKMTGWKRIVLY